MKKTLLLGVIIIFLVAMVFSASADINPLSLGGSTAIPTITVNLAPLTPKTTDNLICTLRVTEGDDPVTGTLTWKVGTSVYGSAINLGSITQGIDHTVTLASSNTHQGENWKCEVTVTGSNPVVSNQVTILDSAVAFIKDIPRQMWSENEQHTLDLKEYFSDADGDAFSISMDPETVEDIAVSINQETKIVTFTPDEDWKGERKVKFKATQGLTTLESNQFSLVVHPEFCDNGEIGDLDITKIDFDEDDFKPGNLMDIDVKVKNDGDDDLDVNVEVILYNINEDDEVVSEKSEEIEIQDGDTEEFNLEIEIPTTNLDPDDSYIIYVKAYEDEDDHCTIDSEEIELNLEKDDVIISNIDVTPSSVEAGQSAVFIVEVWNIGKNDQDDMYVEVKNTDLGISAKSSTFTVDKFGDKDEDYKSRVTVQIPSNAQSKDYSFEVIVYFDNDDVAYDDLATLTVSGGVTPTENVQLIVPNSAINVNKGSSFQLPVTVQNTGTSSGIFTIEISSDFGTDSKFVSLNSGASEAVTFDLTATTEGTHTILVKVKSGTSTIATQTATVNVQGTTSGNEITGSTVFKPTSWFNNADMGQIFWIIADIVLVIVAVFFIVMIATRKR